MSGKRAVSLHDSRKTEVCGCTWYAHIPYHYQVSSYKKGADSFYCPPLWEMEPILASASTAAAEVAVMAEATAENQQNDNPQTAIVALTSASVATEAVSVTAAA